ncbi:MAG: radical SAM protein [Kiritimatiellae bacterium]|nr:radical SAM protein [Kiritimatiellia bacterium]
MANQIEIADPGTVTYRVGDCVYVNLTNRCPCACTFCLREHASGVYGSDSLWLKREPTLEEVKVSLSAWDFTRFREVVFCGYGEPTERLDVLLETAAYIKSIDSTIRVRLNTNGLSDLINARPTAQLFAKSFDCISISLNSSTAEEYVAVCRPKFGEASYAALLKFAREAASCLPEVILTVVGEPITSLEKQDYCRKMAEQLGARLRVRKYEQRPQSAEDQAVL